MTIDGVLPQTLVVLTTAKAEEECDINEGIVSHENLGRDLLSQDTRIRG